ncbi:MAG: NAD-dependent epimerase/dehydratase family protein [Saprospiraceae bacterium]|nr:NAD-dependent epimerase/dehydratase family protein [Saprospiraceae bacterium]
MGETVSERIDRVFITGGTGLLGAHIIDRLLASTDFHILALHRKDSDLQLVPKDERITWIEGDILDTLKLIDAMASCTYSIHAAGQHSGVTSRAVDLKKTNGEGTASVVNAALESGIRRMVHISSVSSLGRTEERLIDESFDYSDYKSHSDYSLSKHLGDLEVYRGRAEGLNANILRPSAILGSGHWSNGSDALFKKVYEGVSFYPVGGTGVVDARDAASLTLQLLTSSDGDLEVIASGHNISIRDLQIRIARFFNRRIPSRELKNWMIDLYALKEYLSGLFRKRRSVVNKNTLLRAQRTFFYDNHRSLEKMGFRYRSLSETIEDCCLAYLKFIKTGEKSVLPI